jgi:DNA segregation ATPase FtsK/SpoIIIE, S-DNA-T family
MPVRGNQFRTNTFREESADNAAPFKKTTIKEKGEGFPKINFNNDRAVKIAG